MNRIKTYPVSPNGGSLSGVKSMCDCESKDCVVPQGKCVPWDLLYDLDLLLNQVRALSGETPVLSREAKYLQVELHKVIG